MVYRLWKKEDYDFINAFDFQNLVKGCVALKNRGRHEKRYLEIYSGFDIETTTTPSHHGFMYHWQLSLNDMVIFGTRWFEFVHVIEKLKKDLQLRKSTRLIIWVANLSFEFSFLRRHFNITRVFAKEMRQPLIVEIDGCIELRDCLQISGGSLKQLAKDFCKTQKMSGDLDYSIQRNSQDGKNLTETEEKYCENDVVILSEYSEYVFNKWIKPEKFIPLTKTGLLRKEVKKGCVRDIQMMVMDCYPDRELYDIMSNFVFRGGFVHANINHVDRVIMPEEGTASYDLTSSYPAHMNEDGFPVGPFVKREPSEFNKYRHSHCTIIHCVFYQIRSRFGHSIESQSKCVRLVNPIIDNGRVSSAGVMDVWLTGDLDLEIYEKLYQWDSVDIVDLYTAVKGYLPEYLLKPVNSAYIEKAKLKKEGKSGTPEYTIKKQFINSGYGLCVQRQVRRDIIYDNDSGEWKFDYSKFNYDREVRKAILLPQWGVWVSAKSRYDLLMTVYDLEYHNKRLHPEDKKGVVIYCDTDSIKMIRAKELSFVIDYYNMKKQENMKKICKKRDLPYDIFFDLGSFEKEYEAVKIKTLGAKRYMVEKDEKIDVTVAGLPKGLLQHYCETKGLDIWDEFHDGMMIDIDMSGKNAHVYHDEPYEEEVNGQIMRELSGCGIFSIPFTMSLDSFFSAQIRSLQAKNDKYETRTDTQDIYNEKRIMELADFMIDYNIRSIRGLAKEFNESEHVIRKMICEELRHIDDERFQQCQNLLKRG